MQVSLEAIKFNHDPDSATEDALNIRRNETETVVVPEWRKGVSILPDDSPAAYAKNAIEKHPITIKAKFSCVNLKIKSVEVCARSIRLETWNHLPYRKVTQSVKLPGE